MMKKLKMKNNSSKKSRRPLTDKEKLLVTILLALISFYLLFKFVLTPQKEKIETLNEDKFTLEQEISENNRILRSEGKIKESWQELNLEKDIIVEDFFPSLDQAQMIYLLNELLLSQDIDSIDLNFSKPSIESINDREVNLMEIYLPFKGGYDGIFEIIRAIEKSPKKIIISSINLDSEEESLSGNMSLKVYSLEGIADTEKGVIHVETTDDNRGNPFKPYVDYKEPDDKFEDNENDKSHGGEYLPEDNAGQSDENINNWSIKDEDNKKDQDKGIVDGELGKGNLIYDFELARHGFFTNTPGFQGIISKSDMSRSGKNSLKLDYALYPSKLNNTGYIDLAMNEVIIDKVEELSLWMYSSLKTSGKISMGFINSVKEDLIVSIVDDINWTGWKKQNISFPKNTSFPLKFDRIILELPNDKEKYGSILFDNIEKDESYIYYQVKAGDTIYDISKKVYNSGKYIEEILKLNGMESKDILYVGKKLKLKKHN